MQSLKNQMATVREILLMLKEQDEAEGNGEIKIMIKSTIKMGT